MFTPRRISAPIKILTAVATLLPAFAIAAGTATLRTENETMQILWQDDGKVRVGELNKQDHVIVRDHKAYAVSTSQGAPHVIDLSSMMDMFSAMADRSIKDAVPDRIDKVEPTGATETVAGIKGHVYNVTTTDSDGKSETLEAVLTDDPLVVELTEVYVSTIRTMTGLEKVDEIAAALPKKHKGILRAGDDFRLESISADAPSADKFELPGQPMDLKNMMQGLKDLVK